MHLKTHYAFYVSACSPNIFVLRNIIKLHFLLQSKLRYHPSRITLMPSVILYYIYNLILYINGTLKRFFRLFFCLEILTPKLHILSNCLGLSPCFVSRILPLPYIFQFMQNILEKRQILLQACRDDKLIIFMKSCEVDMFYLSGYFFSLYYLCVFYQLITANTTRTYQNVLERAIMINDFFSFAHKSPSKRQIICCSYCSCSMNPFISYLITFKYGH